MSSVALYGIRGAPFNLAARARFFQTLGDQGTLSNFKMVDTMADEADIFDCQQCGYCCHGETTVSMDDKDVERMCNHLDMTFEQLKKKYLRVTGNVIQMKIVDGHCIFFDNGCTIHKGKPWRCSQWPIHPSMLQDQANFTAISSSCPGIKKELGYKRFCELLHEVIQKQKF